MTIGSKFFIYRLELISICHYIYFMSDKSPTFIEKENQRLLEENERLQNEVEELSKTQVLDKSLATAVFGGKIMLGSELSDSINIFLAEARKGEFKSESIGNVLTYVLHRLTRLGAFTLLLALIPVSILVLQTFILSEQNDKLQFQNDRIVEQSRLLDGQRRSSYVFLLGGIVEKMNAELVSNDDRTLSKELCSQIIALSHSLTPYKFLLEDGSLSDYYSPERTQLFIILMELQLDKETNSYLLSRGNFDNLYLNDYSILNLKANFFESKNSSLKNVDFKRCELNYIKLEESNNLHNLIIKESRVNSIMIMGTDSLENGSEVNVESSYINMAGLVQSNLNKIELSNTIVNAGVLFANEEVSLNNGIYSSLFVRYDSIFSIRGSIIDVEYSFNLSELVNELNVSDELPHHPKYSYLIGDGNSSKVSYDNSIFIVDNTDSTKSELNKLTNQHSTVNVGNTSKGRFACGVNIDCYTSSDRCLIASRNFSLLKRIAGDEFNSNDTVTINIFSKPLILPLPTL